MSEKPCIWCEGTGFVRPLKGTYGDHVSVMCRTCGGTGKVITHTPAEIAADLDQQLNAPLNEGNIVLPRTTYEQLVPVWGERFRAADLQLVGPRRDFRGWLRTPKGEREVWVGFVDEGRVAFRRKMSESPLL